MEQQTAYLFLISRIIPTVATLIFRKQILKILHRISPPTLEEDLSKPRYLHDQMIDDPETALDLFEKEQERIIATFTSYLEIIRDDPESKPIETEVLSNANHSLFNDIQTFLIDLTGANLSHYASERLLRIENRNNTILSIDEAISSYVNAVRDSDEECKLHTLYSHMTEGLYTMLHSLAEFAESNDADDLEIILSISGDKSELMKNVRRMYMTGDDTIDSIHKPTLINVTNYYQRVVWLVNKLAISMKDITNERN
jgi:phosphate:Na+ symporter